MPHTLSANASGGIPPFPPRGRPGKCNVGPPARAKDAAVIQGVMETLKKCQCTVDTGGIMPLVLGGRSFTRGLSVLRGLCSPDGQKFNVEITGRRSYVGHGSNNLVVIPIL